MITLQDSETGFIDLAVFDDAGREIGKKRMPPSDAISMARILLRFADRELHRSGRCTGVRHAPIRDHRSAQSLEPCKMVTVGQPGMKAEKNDETTRAGRCR
jgi:hypothetical protein